MLKDLQTRVKSGRSSGSSPSIIYKYFKIRVNFLSFVKRNCNLSEKNDIILKNDDYFLT